MCAVYDGITYYLGSYFGDARWRWYAHHVLRANHCANEESGAATVTNLRPGK